MTELHNSALVGLVEAVDLLARFGDQVDLTSLSRYVKSHADALSPVKVGRKTVVDFDLLKRHRQDNVRLTDAKPFVASKSKVDESKAKIRVDRQLKELDLAERQGLLTLVSEVQAAATGAVGAMRAAFDLAIKDTSNRMALGLSVEARLVRPHLRAMEKKALDAFVKTISGQTLLADED